MSVLLGLGGIAWLGALGAGFTLLWQYKSTPAEADQRPPARWPAATRIARDPGRPTLVMFVHPHCPCTRASLAELGRLMARLGDRVAARVRVLRPADAARDWDHTAVWERAAAVPGVEVEPDEDGREAAVFQAVASGQTLLYDAGGALLFTGGLTALRGHEGVSFGQRRILSFVDTGTADRPDSPVFGCSLIGPDRHTTPEPHSRKDGAHDHH